MSATISRPVRGFVLAAVAAMVALGATAACRLGLPRRVVDYQNPVSRAFADTFADPAVVRGRDGWWYAYGTTDPLRAGEGVAHTIPIARSRDLTDWEYVGDAFAAATRPDLGGAGRRAAGPPTCATSTAAGSCTTWSLRPR